MATPFGHIHLDSAPSTQDEARARFEGSPVLVTADRQTAGRGRIGASWENADRAIAASLAVRPVWPRDRWPVVSAAAGLAAASVIGPEALLKWPNDVVVDGRKVAGILAEADNAAVVVGIGINLWWPRPVAGAGALHGTDPGPEAGPELAVRWAADLVTLLARPADDWGRDDYERLSATVGHDVTWQPSGAGRAVGIAADGGLIVETAGGRIVLDSGVVHTIRMPGAG